MTFDQAMAFGLMAVTVGFFIWGKLRYDLIALAALCAGAILGIIPVDDMFSGFANELIWIIAAALLLSAAIERSGVMERVLSPALSALPHRGFLIPAFVTATMLLSMVTKNIGALAILLPVALQQARKTGLAPSRLLMPMAFASLLGGIVTLVGTSPNIVVSSVREDMTGEPFKLLDFAPVGLGVCAAGLVFLVIAPFIIRINRPAPAGVDQALEGARYVTEMGFPPESSWVGQPYAALSDSVGGNVEITAVVTGEGRKRPTKDQVIGKDDQIVVNGEQAELDRFAAAAKLVLVGERHRQERESADSIRVVEGVISADSELVGSTAARARLFERYGVSLIAVSRRGARISTELRSLRLRASDIVILKAEDAQLTAALGDLHILPLTERPLSLGVRRLGYAPVVLLAAAMVAVALGLLPIQLAFVAAAVGVLLLRIMSMSDAYRSMDGSLLVLLAALIPISESITRTGGDKLIAGALAFALEPLPPMLDIGVLIAVGMLVTPFLNNAATVLIVAPIAAAAAKATGAPPDPYLMAVAIGAACDFLTPIGHQCNTLVMGPGGYRFLDYWRLGMPLSAIVLVVATPLIYFVWTPAG